MAIRPTGTVTFLFTDIQGSTRLWQTQPEAMKLAQARHNEILRTAIEAHEGYIFEIVGDALCAVFHKAECAIQAAANAQLKLHAENWGDALIRVRMGIHTGTADLQENGLYSGYITLSHIQRLMSSGHGGQCLVSSTVEPLVRDKLRSGLMLRDLGEHRLKDVPHPERIFQLIIEDLPADFPPLRTLDSSPNNLPVQLTSFIGRTKELADIRRLLPQTHLLTLTGPGGTGKSRLAIQSALSVLETFPHGAWLVELAPVSDSTQVAATALSGLCLPAEVHRPAVDMLCDYLREQELLLILDNCEHLIETCAALVDRLLHAAPKLHILATSREVLGIGGEVIYRVPSLGVPEIDRDPDLQLLSQFEGVCLFIERARAVVPGFQVTNDNAPAVVQICRRLDGIPLAIELAAAKVRALSVEQISKRLDDRFRLLTGGSRTALERHQTLRAALNWSYDFLTPSEQVLFRRLATYVNGWTLESAECVCSGEMIMGGEVFSLLEQLINKSLVATETSTEENRYRMLETMRQYAGEKLIEANESELLHDRHLAYFLQLAETAAPHLIGPEQVEWLERLENEHDNLIAALQWSLGRARPAAALRLSAALWAFWDLRYYWKEGSRWLERALAMPFDNPTLAEKVARARALSRDALLADSLDALERLRVSSEASFALCRERANCLDLAISRMCRGFGLIRLENYDKARNLLETSLNDFCALKEAYWEALCQQSLSYIHGVMGEERHQEQVDRVLKAARKSGERRIIAAALNGSAQQAWGNGQLAEASALVDEAERLYRELGRKVPAELPGMIAHARRDYRRARQLYREDLDTWQLLGEKNIWSWNLQSLSILERDEGNLIEAESLMMKALETAQEFCWNRYIAIRLAFLGQIRFLMGKPEQAKRNFRESLRVGRTGKFMRERARSLILTASYLSHYNPNLAAQLISSVHAMDEKSTGTRILDPLFRRDFDDALGRAGFELAESEFRAAWAEGQKLTIDGACELALKALED